MKGERGVVYLLHFDKPFGHARHYLGWTKSNLSLESRLAHHENGTGANLLRHARAAGVTWVLARVWIGTRDDERAKKRQGGRARMCPICLAERKRLKRQAMVMADVAEYMARPGIE